MPRLFTAVSLPPLITEHLTLVMGGIPGAKWQSADRLHLTLRFIGEVDGGEVSEIVSALREVRADAFELTLSGVGHFPPRGVPRAVWAGVDDPTPLHALHDEIERALVTTGRPPDRRKFAPHVTLARLKNSPERKVGEFLLHHALLRTVPFEVTEFALMSSVLNPGGSRYRVERRFALEG